MVGAGPLIAKELGIDERLLARSSEPPAPEVMASHFELICAAFHRYKRSGSSGSQALDQALACGPNPYQRGGGRDRADFVHLGAAGDALLSESPNGFPSLRHYFDLLWEHRPSVVVALVEAP